MGLKMKEWVKIGLARGKRERGHIACAYRTIELSRYVHCAQFSSKSVFVICNHTANVIIIY